MWTADDDQDDWEYSDESDDETAETLPCRECGAVIYEDAEQCPVCGSYVIRDTNPLRGRSVAWLVLGLAGVVAVIVALLFG